MASTLRCSAACCALGELVHPFDDVVKVDCTNPACTLPSDLMHTSCFESFEESVLKEMRKVGRAKSWTEEQRRENLWVNKGYYLIKRICKCRCGQGYLRRDLSFGRRVASDAVLGEARGSPAKPQDTNLGRDVNRRLDLGEPLWPANQQDTSQPASPPYQWVPADMDLDLEHGPDPGAAPFGSSGLELQHAGRPASQIWGSPSAATSQTILEPWDAELSLELPQAVNGDAHWRQGGLDLVGRQAIHVRPHQNRPRPAPPTSWRPDGKPTGPETSDNRPAKPHAPGRQDLATLLLQTHDYDLPSAIRSLLAAYEAEVSHWS